jgi:hypothetical protein
MHQHQLGITLGWHLTSAHLPPDMQAAAEAADHPLVGDGPLRPPAQPSASPPSPDARHGWVGRSTVPRPPPANTAGTQSRSSESMAQQKASRRLMRWCALWTIGSTSSLAVKRLLNWMEAAHQCNLLLLLLALVLVTPLFQWKLGRVQLAWAKTCTLYQANLSSDTVPPHQLGVNCPAQIEPTSFLQTPHTPRHSFLLSSLSSVAPNTLQSLQP